MSPERQAKRRARIDAAVAEHMSKLGAPFPASAPNGGYPGEELDKTLRHLGPRPKQEINNSPTTWRNGGDDAA